MPRISQPQPWPRRLAVRQRNTVAEALQEAMDTRNKRLEIDADFVLKELHKLYLRVVQEVKPALNSKTGRPLTDDAGNALYTFNANASLKALELMGKHVGVNAFQDRVKVDVEQDLIARLQAGRDRISKGMEDD